MQSIEANGRCVRPIYFALSIEGAPFVGVEANNQTLLLEGRPFYCVGLFVLGTGRDFLLNPVRRPLRFRVRRHGFVLSATLSAVSAVFVADLFATFFVSF